MLKCQVKRFLLVFTLAICILSFGLASFALDAVSVFVQGEKASDACFYVSPNVNDSFVRVTGTDQSQNTYVNIISNNVGLLPLNSDRSSTSVIYAFRTGWDCDFYIGNVYSFKFRFRLRENNSYLDLDLSNLLFCPVWELTSITQSNIQRSNVYDYFPVGFKPSSVNYGPTYADAVYNVAIFSDSAFDPSNFISDSSGDYFRNNLFAFWDLNSDNYSWILTNSAYYTMQLRFVMDQVTVQKMTVNEYIAKSIDNQTEALSLAIQTQTVALQSSISEQTNCINQNIDENFDELIDTINPVVPSPSPIPVDVHNYETELDYGLGVLSSNPYPGDYNFNLTSIMDKVQRGANVGSDWFQWVYMNNSLIYVLVSISFGCLIFYMLFRMVF